MTEFASWELGINLKSVAHTVSESVFDNADVKFCEKREQQQNYYIQPHLNLKTQQFLGDNHM